MFSHLVQELTRPAADSTRQTRVSIDEYLDWQKQGTFDVLAHDQRYGQSFCNHFNIQDSRIFYDRDWVRCDALIRSEWISRN